MDYREAIRLLQEIERPVLVVCAEKFSDKIGTVRTSRMIFGDGAAAVIVGPAPEGCVSDIEVYQTYASGPWSEVNSIIWPNPEFDNNITVYGPEVKSLAKRYLVQMIRNWPHFLILRVASVLCWMRLISLSLTKPIKTWWRIFRWLPE